LRELGPPGGADDDSIRRIFRQTVVLGRSTPFELPDLDRYEALCLGWYLGEGRRWAAVLVQSPPGEAEQVAGYVLVCPDTSVHERWVRIPALRFAARTLVGLASGRYRREARAFWWLRLRDGARSWRRGIPAPMPMHVHLNLDPDVRATSAGRLLVGHADTVATVHGLVGWFGEVNARAGHRAGALERLGATVVHRTPNLTFSWVREEPVERLTVVRTLGQTSKVARRWATASSPTPMWAA